MDRFASCWLESAPELRVRFELPDSVWVLATRDESGGLLPDGEEED